MMPRLSVGCFPYSLYFCDNQKAWNRGIKELSADPKSWTRRWCNHSAYATAWRCEDAKGHVNFIVSFDRAKNKGRRPSQIAGAAAHEATHIVDWIIERTGEEHAVGSEWHAYQVQELTEWMLRHLWTVKK